MQKNVTEKPNLQTTGTGLQALNSVIISEEELIKGSWPSDVIGKTR